ncbi:hypothetical protein DVG80_32335 [Rhodococcus erythropolis]|nr:hypothetical protein DVG80_32335 [Rhodococcus erythropolis]
MTWWDALTRHRDEQALAMAIRLSGDVETLERLRGQDSNLADAYVRALWSDVEDTRRWRNAGVTQENATEKLIESLVGHRYNDAGEKIIKGSERRNFKRNAARCRKSGDESTALEFEQMSRMRAWPKSDVA